MQVTRFLRNEPGAAHSSTVFAAALCFTTLAMLAALSAQDPEPDQALHDLSETQYLSSQGLR